MSRLCGGQGGVGVSLWVWGQHKPAETQPGSTRLVLLSRYPGLQKKEGSAKQGTTALAETQRKRPGRQAPGHKGRKESGKTN